MEKEMGKYLRQVALKTFACALAALVLIITIFLLAFPSLSSDLFGKMGMKGLSADFQKVTYDRSGDVNDLGKLFDRAVNAEKFEYMAKYGDALIKDDNYSDYVDFRIVSRQEVYYDGYVKGYYAVGLFNDEPLDAVKFLKTTVTDGYSLGDAYSYFANYLMSIAKPNKIDKEVISLIDGEFETIYQEISINSGETKWVCADAYGIAVKFGLTDRAKVWESRY